MNQSHDEVTDAIKASGFIDGESEWEFSEFVEWFEMCFLQT